jgi:TolB-like protein/Tfp pilus assembly protein PilF
MQVAPRHSLFLAELKRRKVYRVAVVYGVVGLGILGAAEVILDPLRLGALRPYIVILVLLGFPIALVLAWAYEVKPEEPRPAEPEERKPVHSPGAPSPAGLAEEEKRQSIAVLPFVDMSPGRDQEYFCDGLTEALINTFTSFKELKVVARTSAFSFKGKDVDIREIGRRLEVRSVLEGSVQAAGERLRITTQLIDVASGYHLWSERFDRRMDDVFAIQDEISLAIADNLELTLLEEERSRLVKRHTSDLEAYHYYLRGRHFYNKRTEDGFGKSVENYELALDSDPEFALPYAGLADTFLSYGWYELMPLIEAGDKARQMALRALEMDDSVGAAHTSLAMVQSYFECDWESAGREYQRALELSPSDAEIHHQFAHYLTYLGCFDEALAEMSRALELESLSVNLMACLGQTLYLARRSKEAIAKLQESVEFDPSFPLQYVYLGKAYLQEGRYEEAVETLEKAVSSPSTRVMGKSALGYALAVTGDLASAKGILSELLSAPALRTVDPFFAAMVYIGLDEAEEALDSLFDAHEARSPHLPGIAQEFFFDPLRDHPRFIDLMHKIGLQG